MGPLFTSFSTTLPESVNLRKYSLVWNLKSTPKYKLNLVMHPWGMQIATGRKSGSWLTSSGCWEWVGAECIRVALCAPGDTVDLLCTSQVPTGQIHAICHSASGYRQKFPLLFKVSFIISCPSPYSIHYPSLPFPPY